MPKTQPSRASLVTDDNGMAHAWAPFTGKARTPDGYLMAYGKATGPQGDNDEQGMDPEWLKTQMPEWFKLGNIREMHQASAVGKAMELAQDGDDYFVAGKIVDPLAITKVEEGVYNGWSIGISRPVLSFSDPKFPRGKYVGGRIIELSLADRPALPSAVLTFAKCAAIDGPLELDTAIVGKADKELNEPHAFKPSEDDAKTCATCGATKSKGMHSDSDVGKKVAAIAADPGAYLLGRSAARAFKGKAAAGDDDHSTGATGVLRALAELFTAEVEEMAEGQDEEASLRALLSCYADLKWWLRTEANEGTPVEGEGVPAVDSVMEFMGFTARADVGKAGARHSAADQKLIQAAHDSLIKAGAVCTTDGVAAEVKTGEQSDAPKSENVTKIETPDATKVSTELAAAIESIKAGQQALGARLAQMETIAAPSDVRRLAPQAAQKLARVEAKKAVLDQYRLASTGVTGVAAEGYARLIEKVRTEIAELESTKE